MESDTVVRERGRLANLVRQRYQRRAKERRALLDKVDQEGIFPAAGMPAAIRRTAHMSLAEGRAVIAPRTLEGGSTRTLEAVLGPDDSDSVNFLERGLIAARCVARLVSNGQPVGSGFLVAPGVIITNHHVIPSADAAREFQAEFQYEFDVDDQPRRPVLRFKLAPERLFATSDAEEGLDFAVVAVERQSMGGEADVQSLGWLPMDATIDKILVGEPAIVIQHPRGEPKRLCLFSAELVDKLPEYLHYTTDTDHGSSGSCVVNRSFQLVALHHAAVPSGEKRKGRETTVNEGVRVSSILRALESGTPVQGDARKAFEAISAPDVVRNGRPQAGVRTEARVVEASLEATKLRTLPDDHFSGRRAKASQGYRPDFLGRDKVIPLPRPVGALAADLVQPEGSSDAELRYTHFSVLFSRSRKLPVATGVNIDGRQAQSLGRTDRQFEAADVWSLDPRVPAGAQLGPSLYDRTDFDFGHIVRREDPVWGDLNTARMANDDTFFMTNCTPQHKDVNQKTWVKLENAVRDFARSEGRKVSVFTGPVLTVKDPVILGVKIPTAFWKIVAYVESGKMVARGFMQYQDELVRALKVRPESISKLDEAVTWQVPIREIARATGLDFGPLVSLDQEPVEQPVDGSSLEALFPATGSMEEEPTLDGVTPKHRSAVADERTGRVLDALDQLEQALLAALAPGTAPAAPPDRRVHADAE